MAEMALTADHVIVIGRGRLLAEASIHELIQSSSQNFVRVRSLHDAQLTTLVEEKGGSSRPEADGALAVTGISAAAIGDLAGTNGIFLHELSPVEVSLEEVYMDLTHDSVEYRAGQPEAVATAPKVA
jgi:ABC-2 type transport system ATP-binding protein